MEMELILYIQWQGNLVLVYLLPSSFGLLLKAIMTFNISMYKVVEDYNALQILQAKSKEWIQAMATRKAAMLSSDNSGGNLQSCTSFCASSYQLKNMHGLQPWTPSCLSNFSKIFLPLRKAWFLYIILWCYCVSLDTSHMKKKHEKYLKSSFWDHSNRSEIPLVYSNGEVHGRNFSFPTYSQEGWDRHGSGSLI